MSTGNSSMVQSALGSFLKAGVAANKGESAIAASLMHEAMAQVKWDTQKSVHEESHWRFYADKALATLGSFYVDVENQRVLTSMETWDLLSYDSQTKWAVVRELRTGSGGVKIYPLDDGPLLAASRAKYAMDPSATPVLRVDRLADMKAKAEKLILAATSLNEVGASNEQRQIFHVRFADLMDEWREVQAQVAEISAVIDLAVDAV